VLQAKTQICENVVGVPGGEGDAEGLLVFQEQMVVETRAYFWLAGEYLV
jgi:hypothetical protein